MCKEEQPYDVGIYLYSIAEKQCLNLSVQIYITTF